MQSLLLMAGTYAILSIAGISLASAATWTVTSTTESGPGSWHAAVDSANLSGAARDTIAFNIPGFGPFTILITGVSPPITKSHVLIDGYTQPGAAANTLVEGDNAVIQIVLREWSPHFWGVLLGADSCVVRGLAITNFTWGIYIAPPAVGNVVEGNFIGVNAAGTACARNDVGILDWGVGTRIGGTSPAARNIISCNLRGIGMYDSASGNVVQGNYIGTDRNGTVDFGNALEGVYLHFTDSCLLGGSAPGARNVISGDSIGIYLDSVSTGNLIEGNFIGTDKSGTAALGNTAVGIIINESSGNTIGGAGVASANVIAHTSGGGGDGIRILGVSQGNRILANTFIDNAALGIELGSDGVTPNDAGDEDTGPNDLQNYPLLTDAKNTFGGGYVLGSLNSTPSTSFLVQVFSSASCDPSGHGEGEETVDTFTVSTNVSGNASFVHEMIVAVPNGSVLTATATDPAGSTSEFSNCVTVLPAVVGDTLAFYLFSPVNMVVTDPLGDSIGIDSASSVVFNTVLNGSSYDTTTDLNSSDLSGPDGSSDDIVTIANPIAGDYRIRVFREDGAADSDKFTLAIRIDGNQLMVPEDYFDATVSSLGTTLIEPVVWSAATTLPGDCNADGVTTSADIIRLVNYVFKGGLPPVVTGHGDVNCSGATTSADIIYLVNYVFKGDVTPCSRTAG